MKCKDCAEDGTIKLAGPTDLCAKCFEARCTDTSLPAMGSRFGPSVLMLEWDPQEAVAVVDCAALDMVDNAIKEFIEFNGDVSVIIAQEVTLNAFRLAIVDGKIPPYHVALRYDGSVYQFNKYGNFEGESGWPFGLAVSSADVVCSILRGQCAIRKEHK